MLAQEILEVLRTCDTSTIDLDTAVEIYAHLLAELSATVPEQDIRKLVIVGAAIYRNVSKTGDLTFPGGLPAPGTVEPLGRIL